MDISLEAMRKKVEETTKLLEEEKAVLSYLERMAIATPERNGWATTQPPSSLESPSEEIDLNDIELPEKAIRKPTMMNDITDVIERLGSQEFTVNHIHAVLRKQGKGNDAKHYKNRISLSVRKLTNAGKIVLTHKGSGNDPHKYKLAENNGK